MPRRVRHATDEEKLACSGIMGQKAKKEAEVEEDSACAKGPANPSNVKSQALLDGKFGLLSGRGVSWVWLAQDQKKNVQVGYT
jgi:hypothetical protein